MSIQNSLYPPDTRENLRFSVNWEIPSEFPVSQKSLCDSHKNLRFSGHQKREAFFSVLGSWKSHEN